MVDKKLKVKCRGCAIVFLYYESDFRPFCSERCKMIDLGHWFKETYTMPTNEKVETEKEIGVEDEDEDIS